MPPPLVPQTSLPSSQVFGQRAIAFNVGDIDKKGKTDTVIVREEDEQVIVVLHFGEGGQDEKIKLKSLLSGYHLVRAELNGQTKIVDVVVDETENPQAYIPTSFNLFGVAQQLLGQREKRVLATQLRATTRAQSAEQTRVDHVQAQITSQQAVVDQYQGRITRLEKAVGEGPRSAAWQALITPGVQQEPSLNDISYFTKKDLKGLIAQYQTLLAAEQVTLDALKAQLPSVSR